MKSGKNFIKFFEAMQEQVHETAVAKGWWEDDERHFGEIIANIHGEVSEAWEAYRAGDPPDDKISDFSGIEAEFADTIIRIMDTAQKLNLRVAEALVKKAEFNKGREYRHGGKQA